MAPRNNNTTTRSEKMKKKGTGNRDQGSGRKVGIPHPKFTAGMTTNLDKERQLCHVVAAVGNLAEELRILRQTEGVSAGEKKAIGAMLDKLGKFKDYAANCLIMKGGAK